jgi:hypothetical protein
MAKRPNPTISGTDVNMTPAVDGLDNLPLPSGVNVGAKEGANAMPDVNMKTNDGDNPPAVQPPFANGKDMRVQRSTPTSDPTPAKPGA